MIIHNLDKNIVWGMYPNQIMMVSMYSYSSDLFILNQFKIQFLLSKLVSKNVHPNSIQNTTFVFKTNAQMIKTAILKTCKTQQ